MTVRIGDIELPPALCAAIADGTWSGGVAPLVGLGLFGESPDESALLYSTDEMLGETKRWSGETNPAYLGHDEFDLDPGRSVLIGDLGIDRPLALDYRTVPPAVRLLAIDGRWVLVAENIDALLERLRSLTSPSG